MKKLVYDLKTVGEDIVVILKESARETVIFIWNVAVSLEELAKKGKKNAIRSFKKLRSIKGIGFVREI